VRSFTFVSFAAFLMLGSCTEQSAFAPLSSTILVGDQTRELQPCTGYAPTTDVWNPSERQIAELEERLFPTLAAQVQQIRPNPNRVGAEDYYRQYAGFVLGARRIIYVSGFHRHFIEVPQQPDGFRTRDGRREAVCVFDGGPSFFSAEYDVDATVLRNFAFNPVGG
jgi:hypothetical protein